jgi:glycosyltransferase involved in cell wall biosynthesis
LRVLFLNPIGQLGGAERILLDLVRSLREHEASLEISVLSLAEGPLVRAVSELGFDVRVVRLPRAQARLGDSGLGLGTLADLARSAVAGPAFAQFLHRLRREIRALRPDIVHSNGLKSHVLGAWLRPRGSSLIWHLHDFVSFRRTMRSILPRLESRASAAICVSEAVKRDARRVFGKLSLVTVLNGVDTRAFADSTTPAVDLDALAGLDRPGPATVRVGLLATQASWKGHRLFLDAAARTSDPRARFYVVGGSIYTTRGSETDPGGLRRSIVELGLSKRCGLVPFQVDPRGVYRALDIVVNASTRPEPFGRTVAEALAAGLTVVGPSSGGVLEQIADGVTGRLYAPGDAGALSATLTGLMASPEERRRLGLAAAGHARIHLDAARLGPEVLSVYDRARHS